MLWGNQEVTVQRSALALKHFGILDVSDTKTQFVQPAVYYLYVVVLCLCLSTLLFVAHHTEQTVESKQPLEGTTGLFMHTGAALLRVRLDEEVKEA